MEIKDFSKKTELNAEINKEIGLFKTDGKLVGLDFLGMYKHYYANNDVTLRGLSKMAKISLGFLHEKFSLIDEKGLPNLEKKAKEYLKYLE